MNPPTPAETVVTLSSTHFDLLRTRIATREARVGVMGLGYVGLPLACAFAEAGFKTTGFEIDREKVARIQNGGSYIADVPASEVGRLVQGRRLQASADLSLLGEQDVVIICVPTPLSKSKDPDISAILSAVRAVGAYSRPGQLVVLESTTYPGTTREVLLPALAKPDFQVGRDYFLAFSPERVDPGNPRFNIRNTPKVVGGLTPRCLELASSLYASAVETVFPVSSVEVAEMTKLLENTFRAVNIGLVNEMAMICERLGVNVWDVIEAAKTKPFGFMSFQPGPGIGGHCIPLDPHYLAWKVKSLNFEPRFIGLADAINCRMPEFVVEKAADLLNARLGKCLSQSAILVLGVAYKKDAADIRESPALDIMERLRGKGARLLYHDPHIPGLSLKAETLSSQPLDSAVISSADLVLILTDHSSVDYPAVLRSARLIFDTRNALKGRRAETLFYL